MHRNNGFSLVELSIVLVILGLMVGGILGGQALIKAAELRKVTTEWKEIHTAYNAFRDKYNAISGDFNQATRFWPVAGNCGFSAFSAAQTDGSLTGTCNGNADGQIATYDLADPPEQALHWQHYRYAGLLPGDPLGTTRDLQSAYAGDAQWYANYHPDKNENLVQLITTNLQPEDAWSIDVKMDDGKPNTGKVIGLSLIPSSECIVLPNGDPATVNDLDAVYHLASADEYCALRFYYR